MGYSYKEQLSKALDTKFAINDSELVNIEAIVGNAYLFKGQTIDAKLIKKIACQLQKEIKTFFSDLHIKELEIAINNGLFGRYGNYFNISLAEIIKWISSYHESNDRINAIQNKSFLAISDKSTITEFEKEKIILNYIYKCFQSYKKNKCYNFDFKGFFYNHLKHYYNQKNVDFDSITNKENAWKFICEYELKNINSDDRKNYNKILNKEKQDSVFFIFQDKILKKYNSFKEKCIIQTKRLIVKNFFEYLIKFELNLSDLLSD